jgi:CDP-6-deoxy-D-xylo-4-hexulose-3-dehydrase
MKEKIISYTYPCTRNIDLKGFGVFLENEIGAPRKNIKQFAEEFSTLVSTDGDDISKHLVMVNSGSSANLVAALALAQRCKQEKRPLTAAVSAFTFPTTISSLLLAGFSIRIVDVDEMSFNLSIKKLCEENEFPSLVVVTHFLGFPADLEALVELKKEKGFLILQDACETLDVRIGNKPLYKYGDIITWSFYHPHHLSSYGGGAVYSVSAVDFIMTDSIAHWGRACKCHIDESLCKVPAGPAHQFTYENIGVNVEMSELNACFGRWQLRNWEEIENQRQRNYSILYDMLSTKQNLTIWPFFNERRDSPFVFPILYKTGSIHDVFEKLSPQGIEIRTLMGGSACQQSAFQGKISFDKCDNASYMSNHAFFVGCHHTLSENDVRHIGSQISMLLD